MLFSGLVSDKRSYMANRERSWLSESLLIVISILVAFAIDAWWDERNERKVEHRILASLRAEFQANAEMLPRYIAFHQKAADYAHQLIPALSEAGAGNSVAVEDKKMMWLISNSSTDPQRGALDAVLQSGGLRFIQNQTISERLASWPQKIVDATENEELLRKIWGPMFNQALARRVDIARINSIPEKCWEDFDEALCRVGDFEIPHDTELIGYLSNVRGYSAEAARELELLRIEALGIVELLTAELGAHE